MKNKLYITTAIATLLSTQVLANENIISNEDQKDHNKIIMERVMVIGNSDNIANIPGAAHLIDKKNLDNHNYTNIHSVLKQIPGINIQEEEGFGNRPNIGFRGGRVERSADITLMEDGILIAPAPYSAPSAYYFPRISRMEAVEVRKGSSTIEFGPRTTSGALNLISSSTPEKAEFDVLLGYGSHNSKRAQIHQGNKFKNFSYVIDAGHEESSGFKKIDIVGGDTGYSIQDVMTKFKFNTNDDAKIYQSIELKLGYTQEDSDETYLGLTDQDFNNDPYRRYAASQKDNLNTNHQQYQLRHFVDFNSFDLTTTLYRNDFSRNWYKLKAKNDEDTYNATGLTVRANNRDYYSQGIQSILGTELKTGELKHKFKFSARYHQDQEDRFQRNDVYDLTNGVMKLKQWGDDGAAGDQELSSDALALYVSDSINLDKLTITPGLRYEYIKLDKKDYNSPSANNTNTIDAYIPGVGSVYKFNDNVSTFASVHKGFSPPTPGSSDRKKEDSTNYEIGFRYNKNSFSSELVGFFNDYSNLLGECTASSGGGCNFGDQFNAGEVQVKGFELSTSYDIANYFNINKFKLPVTVNYTYTDAEFRNNFESKFEEWGNVTQGDKLPYTAKDQLFVSIGIENPKWELHFNSKYVGKMRSKAGNGHIPNGESIKSHFIVDLASEIEIYDKTKLFLNIENIFDKQYMVARRPTNARPGKPLSIMTGIKYKF
jgi:Fe(3+) dicitrate transport protein